MKNHMDLLGHRVQDKITGLIGVVTSICFDLYGCVQAVVHPGLDKDGNTAGSFWIDVKRLVQLTKVPLMTPPDFDQPEIGPAEKPRRAG